MKVYRKIVMDWDGNILEEDSFEYHGPVAQAMGSRPKPPPPPPPAPEPAPPPPPPAPEPEAEAVADATEKMTKETSQRRRRQGRTGLTTGSPLGYDQPFVGNRRSLL